MMKITDSVYMLNSSWQSHVYLVLTPEPVLIDTGMSFSGKAIQRELESLSLKEICHILLSHHDVDHIGNAAKLRLLRVRLSMPPLRIFLISQEKRSATALRNI